MQITSRVSTFEEKVTAIQCDKCQKKFDDVLDMQEFVSISATAGYGSAWGDGKQYSVDLCSGCSLEVLGPYATIQA